jgi:hypothetical protein
MEKNENNEKQLILKQLKEIISKMDAELLNFSSIDDIQKTSHNIYKQWDNFKNILNTELEKHKSK